MKKRRSQEEILAEQEKNTAARRAKIRKQREKKETRRKILIGEVILDEAKSGDLAAQATIHRAKDRMSKGDDKDLFEGLMGDSPDPEPSLDQLTKKVEAAWNEAAEEAEAGTTSSIKADAWRRLAVELERRTGESCVDDDSPENRAQYGLGPIGQLLDD